MCHRPNCEVIVESVIAVSLARSSALDRITAKVPSPSNGRKPVSPRPALELPRNDAQVLIVGFHQDVSRTEMDLVGSDVAAHHQEPTVHFSPITDRQSRDQPAQQLLTGLRRLAEFTEAV